MYTHFKKSLSLCLVVLVFPMLLGCTGSKLPADNWEVLFPSIPSNISPLFAGENDVLYVLKQTHEPLLRKDDGQNFHSRILKNWKRNANSTEYEFCPDISLQFDASHSFTAGFLEAHVRKITRNFAPSFNLARENGCVSVRFDRSRKNYMNYLSFYENAPSLKQRDNIEAGLGAFTVRSISKNKIVLERRKAVRAGYNTIIVRSYAGPGDSLLESRKITDFNRIPVNDVPPWVKRSFMGFNSITLKSTVLIINHPDKRLRNLLYNCMNVGNLRAAFFPLRTDFQNIKNILPVGVPGAQPGMPSQTCQADKNEHFLNQELVFANWRTGNEKQLQEAMRDFYKQTGLHVRVVNISPDMLTPQLFKRPHPFNLLIISFDAVRSEHSAFFDYVLRKDGYLDFDLPETMAKYKKMLQEEDEEAKLNLASEIAADISKQMVVLPLYQDIRVFYYPDKIKNIEAGRGFLEYPDVGDLRW